VPRVGDHVVGLVADHYGDAYKIDLPGARVHGRLGVVAFDGATLRNRPYLKVGDAVHCRVEVARTETEGVDAELTCREAREDDAKGWMTKEARFGQLDRGATACLVRCAVGYARALSSGRDGRHNTTPGDEETSSSARRVDDDRNGKGQPQQQQHPVLRALARHFDAFKVVVGANGCLWIHTGRTIDTTVVANAILNAQDLRWNHDAEAADGPSDDEARYDAAVSGMVDHLVQAVHAETTLARVLKDAPSADHHQPQQQHQRATDVSSSSRQQNQVPADAPNRDAKRHRPDDGRGGTS